MNSRGCNPWNSGSKCSGPGGAEHWFPPSFLEWMYDPSRLVILVSIQRRLHLRLFTWSPPERRLSSRIMRNTRMGKWLRTVIRFSLSPREGRVGREPERGAMYLCSVVFKSRCDVPFRAAAGGTRACAHFVCGTAERSLSALAFARTGTAQRASPNLSQ